MLKPKQREQIRQLIITRIAELEESIPRLQERMGPVSPDVAIGRLSRTDSMINAGTLGLAIKDAQSKLTRLRNRLAKIDDPAGFDQCGMCGQPIEWGRLLAAPDRGTCPTCLAKVKK